MAALPEHRVSPEEYLRLDCDSEIRNEYYDGFVCPVSGPSRRHNTIVLNLGAEFRTSLRNTRCTPWVNTMRVRVSPGRVYVYPDVVVVCGEQALADEYGETLLNPTLILEVLSPSTERNDRGLKWTHYRKLESLREYVLVSQTEPRIEFFRRHPEGQEWLFSETFGLESVCRFESVDCEIPFSEIYRDVEFDALPPTP